MPTHQQYKKLRDALISAFPLKVALEQLLFFELGRNLNQITQDSNLQTVVFQLIQTAEAQGWLIKLIEAARKENPGNAELAAIAQELLSSETSSAPKPLLSNSVTVVEPLQEQEVEESSGITSKFDVFLAHNSADKLSVRVIFDKLKQRGLKPWLDDEQIPPGRPFQDEIQQAIPLVKSAAIFLGLQGLGRWQVLELRSLINQCVQRQIPVIPVLLPGVNNLPENLLFLQEFRWVTFSNKLDDEQALDLLQWGITEEKPTQLLNSSEKPGHVPTLESLDKNFFKRIFQCAKPSTQQLKILVVRAAVVVVFVLIAYGATLSFFHPVAKFQPIASSSPTNSTNPSKPEQSTSVPSDDNLPSQKGVDYTQLRDLLKAGKWQDADDETYKVMLKVVGGKEGELITSEHLLNFPCTDLRTIDNLWVKYSLGRFGFSVQKKIYLEVGGLPDGKYHEGAWNKFGDRVGWRVYLDWISYSQVTFDTTAPVGHIPTVIRAGYGSERVLGLSSLASRLVNCNL